MIGAGGVRIGIDTGGTFTDVVAVEPGGRMVTSKVPSTPGDPSVAFLRAIEKALGLAGASAEAVGDVAHGTTVATNALLEDDFSGLGFITTKGFRAVLEVGRQSVPDSYGNSYFWVKPERIVPLHLVQEVDERLDRSGAVIRELDEDGARAVARWFREQGIAAVGVCLLHAYMNPDARAAHARAARRGAPGVRGVAELGRAERVPRVRALGDDAGRRVRQAAGRRLRAVDRRPASGATGRRSTS